MLACESVRCTTRVLRACDDTLPTHRRGSAEAPEPCFFCDAICFMAIRILTSILLQPWRWQPEATVAGDSRPAAAGTSVQADDVAATTRTCAISARRCLWILSPIDSPSDSDASASHATRASCAFHRRGAVLSEFFKSTAEGWGWGCSPCYIAVALAACCPALSAATPSHWHWQTPHHAGGSNRGFKLAKPATALEMPLTSAADSRGATRRW